MPADQRVREAGVIRSQAVLIAVAVGWDGRRSVLGVELANRESRSSWRNFLLGMKERGVHADEFVMADTIRAQDGGARRHGGSGRPEYQRAF